jgi:hypothetical protein
MCQQGDKLRLTMDVKLGKHRFKFVTGQAQGEQREKPWRVVPLRGFVLAVVRVPAAALVITLTSLFS